MQRLIKLVFKIFIFLLPTQLAYHFWPDWALIFGIRVDYLSPAVYLSDLLAISLIVLYFFQAKKFHFKNLKILTVILGFIFLNIFFAIVPAAAFFKWFKVLEMTLVFLVAKNYKPLDLHKDFLRPLLYSSAFISLIGIFQFFRGQTLGSLFYLLGERSFNIITPGIALARVFNNDFLRAYSIFSHPNSLAGYLSVVLILVLNYRNKLIKDFSSTFAVILMVIALGLTFSLGAFISLALAFLFHKFFLKNPPRVLIVIILASISLLFLPLLNPAATYSESIQERLSLAQTSKQIFLKSPLLGVGLNNFTAAKTSWSLQPVHNIYLLILAETGIIGIGGFFVFLKFALQKASKLINPGFFVSLLFILFSGLIDHYSLTLQQNVLLFSLVLGYSLKDK